MTRATASWRNWTISTWRSHFRNILTTSVQYTVLTRCVLDPSDYLEDEDLAGIAEFSTPAVLHHLGNAASKVSMDLFNEIFQLPPDLREILDTLLAMEKKAAYPADF